MVYMVVLYGNKNLKETSTNDKDGLSNPNTQTLDLECVEISLVNSSLSPNLASTTDSLAICDHGDTKILANNEVVEAISTCNSIWEAI